MSYEFLISKVSDVDIDPTGGKLPLALVKAVYDPFDYAIGLRDGRVIHFTQAQLQQGGEWIFVSGNGNSVDYDDIEMSGVEHGFPRGIYVRVSDIMWAADAPNGS